MRLDVFLKAVGIVKRRPEVSRLLRDGLLLVDEEHAKPASTVRAGQKIRLRRERWERLFEVLEVPSGNVAKADRERYARLLSETSRTDS